jgi:hypothetical protein
MNAMKLVGVLLLSTACGGPMEVQVINYTGGQLFLTMPTEMSNGEGVVYQDEVIPADGGTFDFKGAPALNKTWDISISTSGAYSMSSKSVEGNRDAPVSVTYDENDINAFVVIVSNDTGGGISSLYFKNGAADGGQLSDGETPGTDYGPLAAGATIDVSLSHEGDTGWSYIYYPDSGGSSVNALGSVNTTDPGMDTNLSLF